MQICALVLFLILIILAPVKASNAQDNLKGVLYWANGKDGVELHIYLPDQKKDTVFLRARNHPRSLKWTMDMKTLFYIADNELFKVEWKWGAQPERMLSIPAEAVKSSFQSTWIDESKNRWRTAYILEGFRESDFVPVKRNDREEYYLIHGGDRILFENEYYKRYGGLAIVQEYVPGQGWRTIAKRSTACQAQSDPCMDVIEDFLDPVPMVSTEDFRLSMTIETKLESAEWLKGGREDGIAYIPSKWVNNRGLKVKVHLGDTYHAIAPLAYVNKDSNTETIVYERDVHCNDFPQLGFEEYRGLLLVGTEYQSKCARVIEMKKGVTVFVPPTDSSAVWVEIPRRQKR